MTRGPVRLPRTGPSPSRTVLVSPRTPLPRAGVPWTMTVRYPSPDGSPTTARYATSSPNARTVSPDLFRCSSSRSRRSARQMLLLTVPTLIPSTSAISGSVLPS